MGIQELTEDPEVRRELEAGRPHGTGVREHAEDPEVRRELVAGLLLENARELAGIELSLIHI
eukprot:15448280-Alexandrium_andersonii.AAC.1